MFSQINKEINAINELTKGKEKMEMSELYGEECTIIDFSLLKDSNEKEYAIVILKEYPNNFHFAGMQETSACKAVLEYGLYDELKSTGMRVKYTLGKTSKGKKFTKVDVLN